MKNTGVDFIGYEKSIQNHREKRKQDNLKFILISSETEMVIDQFNGTVKKSIDFDRLNSFELNKWIQINEKVKIRRTYGDGRMIAFDTKMEPGGKFGWHYHSDCREIIDVIKGTIYDLESKKTTVAGEIVTFPKGREHIPTALEETTIRVYFDRCDADCPLVNK